MKNLPLSSTYSMTGSIPLYTTISHYHGCSCMPSLPPSCQGCHPRSSPHNLLPQANTFFSSQAPTPPTSCRTTNPSLPCRHLVCANLMDSGLHHSRMTMGKKEAVNWNPNSDNAFCPKLDSWEVEPASRICMYVSYWGGVPRRHLQEGKGCRMEEG